MYTLADLRHTVAAAALQAAMEIRQLKATVAGGESRIKELVQQVRCTLPPCYLH